MKNSSLLLVFESPNDTTISILFQIGNDLRQDMLILDAIRWMKVVWHAESLDLQMTPYSCLATDIDSGMIEVITPASTTAKIVSDTGVGLSSMRSTVLLQWLSNGAKEQRLPLATVIENFTNSCAGYFVVR